MQAPTLDEERFLLVGLGVTNAAVATELVARGYEVTVVDDGDGDGPQHTADALGVPFHRRPDRSVLASLVERCDAVVPSPGLPERHPVFEAAVSAQRPVLSEFDFAAAWDDRPVLAVTGTNGKTTVSMLVADMLIASGVRTAAVGNLEVPLVAAIADPDPACFVVEASSFRLAHSRWFRPKVGTWLNFAEDHLDVHLDLERYRAAKARIWSDQGPGDVAVVNAADPIVAAAAQVTTGAAVHRFALAAIVDGQTVDYHEADGQLVGPSGTLVATDALWRTLPHDRANALAAAATALGGGATMDGVRTALREFRGLPHRVELVAEIDGVRWYDDSKATAPHATLAALTGFDDVVLIAGGRNKGLDMAVLGDEADRVRAVVGIGESAEQVVGALPGRPSVIAQSMEHAVAAAAELAGASGVVLLSPGCASFDWYGSYAERGDDFARCVRELNGVSS
ncbi:MAG: UDP-N-acetylmuramoyl-L-alanine--D-glutamate ligase [Actinomycetes bacterium]